MKVTVLANADAVAQEAATIIAAEARAAVAVRGLFIMAVSGGHTPWQMLRALAGEEVPWQGVHVVQVDERVAPAGHPDRNLTHLRDSLLDHAPLRPEQIYAMPVEAPDLEAAARRYALTLQEIAGAPPVLDLAHLGLVPDGHTASLVPGDPVLNVTDADVALTGVYPKAQRGEIHRRYAHVACETTLHVVGLAKRRVRVQGLAAAAALRRFERGNLFVRQRVSKIPGEPRAGLPCARPPYARIGPRSDIQASRFSLERL